jgi:hypothetical protein
MKKWLDLIGFTLKKLGMVNAKENVEYACRIILLG